MTDVQKLELKILKEVTRIIEKHHLRYFALGGTCLGAIRHRGFIPWDDDVDIAMPRDDYERFRTKFYKELPTKFKKLDYDNSESNTFLFTKIHDSTTTFVENYAKDSPDRYTGVFVDIVPLDGLPEKSAKKEIRKSEWLRRLNKWTRKVPKSYRKQHGILKYIFHKCFSTIFPYNYFSDCWCKNLQKYSFDDSSMVYFGYQMQTQNHGPLPHSYFASYQSVPFEDIEIRVPVNYDGYLSNRYGDYMEYPSPEHRNSGHNAYILDLETPCSYYAERKKQENL